MTKAVKVVKALLSELEKVKDNPQAAGEDGWEAEGYTQEDYFESEIMDIESTSIMGCKHKAMFEIRDDLMASLSKAHANTVYDFSKWFRVAGTANEEVYEIAVNARNEFTIFNGTYRLAIEVDRR